MLSFRCFYLFSLYLLCPLLTSHQSSYLCVPNATLFKNARSCICLLIFVCCIDACVQCHVYISPQYVVYLVLRLIYLQDPKSLLAICFTLLYCLVYSLALKMELIYFSEMLVDLQVLHDVIYQKMELF
jgi:hypothetical protein